MKTCENCKLVHLQHHSDFDYFIHVCKMSQQGITGESMTNLKEFFMQMLSHSVWTIRGKVLNFVLFRQCIFSIPHWVTKHYKAINLKLHVVGEHCILAYTIIQFYSLKHINNAHVYVKHTVLAENIKWNWCTVIPAHYCILSAREHFWQLLINIVSAWVIFADWALPLFMLFICYRKLINTGFSCLVTSQIQQWWPNKLLNTR